MAEQNVVVDGGKGGCAVLERACDLPVWPVVRTLAFLLSEARMMRGL